MPERPQTQVVRVFLSSPGDVADERASARRLLKEELPYDRLLQGRVTFEVVSWDDPAGKSPMPATLTPQAAVNRLTQLQKGVNVWNAWRIRPNLSRAELSGADLQGADLHEAKLDGANLSGADLQGADLHEAKLSGANLKMANLRNARLCRADLKGANLRETNLTGADLRGADLGFAILVDTDLTNADLTGSRVYGISAWRLKTDGARQMGLIMTESGELELTVDDIEVVNFTETFLHNYKIRNVIDTLSTKVVLILGRFTEERKAVLDALRYELRKRNYLPILFDFEAPATRAITETFSLLAHMARFIIADISDATSVLHELRAIVPALPSVPVQPIIVATQNEPIIIDFFRHFPWVLETYRYHNLEQLLANVDEGVIRPAEAKIHDLTASGRYGPFGRRTN